MKSQIKVDRGLIHGNKQVNEMLYLNQIALRMIFTEKSIYFNRTEDGFYPGHFSYTSAINLVDQLRITEPGVDIHLQLRENFIRSKQTNINDSQKEFYTYLEFMEFLEFVCRTAISYGKQLITNGSYNAETEVQN